MPLPTQYEKPYIGQRFQQIHDRPNFVGMQGRIKYGTVVGMEEKCDTAGKVVSWMAVIECGFANPDRIRSNTGWNTPSMWHPIPAEDLRGDDAIRALTLRLVALEANLGTLAAVSDAAEGDAISRTTVLEARVEKLEEIVRVATTPAEDPPPPARQRGK